MADSRSAAKAATAFTAGAPKGARLRIPLLPMSMAMMYSGVMQHYPEANWETNNLWTHADADQLLPHIQRIAIQPHFPINPRRKYDDDRNDHR